MTKPATKPPAASPAKKKPRPALPAAGGSWTRRQDGGLAAAPRETKAEDKSEAVGPPAADTPPAGKED